MGHLVSLALQTKCYSDHLGLPRPALQRVGLSASHVASHLLKVCLSADLRNPCRALSQHLLTHLQQQELPTSPGCSFWFWQLCGWSSSESQSLLPCDFLLLAQSHTWEQDDVPVFCTCLFKGLWYFFAWKLNGPHAAQEWNTGLGVFASDESKLFCFSFPLIGCQHWTICGVHIEYRIQAWEARKHWQY